MPAENSQLLGLWPQPVSRSGSNVASGTVDPNALVLTAPQVSMLPVVAGLCRPLFDRSQLTTLSLLLSDHVRNVFPASAFAGFGDAPKPFSVCPSRYLLAATFTADLPSPRTSHTKPMRYVMSFQFKSSCSGNVMFRFWRPSTAAPGPMVCAGKLVLNQSYRIAPVTVR